MEPSVAQKDKGIGDVKNAKIDMLQPLNSNSPSLSRRRNSASSEDPPVYFDSEPSSQPPNYNKNLKPSPSPSPSPRDRKSGSPQPHRPEPQTAGASAASIAAILGASSMSEIHENDRRTRHERSFGRRVKDFFTGGKGWDLDEGHYYGSTANANVFGYRLDGRENREKRLK